MDHEDDHEEMEVENPTGNPLESTTDQPMFTGWNQSDQSLASMTGNLVDNLRDGDKLVFGL